MVNKYKNLGKSLNHEAGHKKPYSGLFWMALIHLPAMYLIMFTMIDSIADFYMNLNTFYMAVMMVAPMVISMPLLMKSMYPNKKANVIVYISGFSMLIAFYLFVRQQTAIGNTAFIRSMIPHHSGAILMCQESKIDDPELKALCKDIVIAQRKEIDQMKTILQRLNGR